MKDEPEVMSKVAALLEPLDGPARSRVLAWVIGALNVQGLPRDLGGQPAGKATVQAPSLEIGQLNSFPEFFHAASPKSEKEKALVAAYWIQHNSGVEQFGSQDVNTELKHIGYGVGNITDALTQLINERPSAVIQLKKAGSSKQARKVYKVTDAGSRRIVELMNSSKEE
jgi:hypothetical protein